MAETTREFIWAKGLATLEETNESVEDNMVHGLGQQELQYNCCFHYC